LARWPPIFPISIAGGKLIEPGAPVPVNILLQLNAYELKPGVESVMAFFGQRNSEKRLIYGEIRNGIYEPVWDSPLIGGGNLGRAYEDVNADGVREIVISWTELPRGTAMAIFSIDGEEITRQACKDERRIMLAAASGSACPVRGRSITLAEAVQGSRDIILVPYNSENDSDTDTYALREGHYKLPTSRLKSIAPKSLRMSSEPRRLVLLGTNFAHGSLVTFTPAEGDGYFTPDDRFTNWPVFISDTRLRVDVPTDLLSRKLKWNVTVENSSSSSNSLVVSVEAAPSE